MSAMPRMHVLDLGRMHIDRSLLVARATQATRSNPSRPAELVEMPILAYLVDHPEGRILYDTGCNPHGPGPDGHWPAAMQDGFPYTGGEECQLPNRLAQLGLGPDDIRHVVISHMHYDHAGCVELFRKSRLIVHEDELSAALRLYAMGPRPSPYCWAEMHRWVPLGLGWHPLAQDEGDVELADGVTILNWGSGHAYGMLGLEVRLRGTGTVILTSDAVYCGENYGPPVRMPGIARDTLGVARTIERIRRRAERSRAQVWFGHDMAQFRTLRSSTEGWYE